MNHHFLTAGCVLIGCAVLLPLQADIFVVPGGTGPSPYNSWATAAPDIQTAVTAAAPFDTIFISNGTYVLNAPIALTKSLTLRGIPEVNPPTIDGNNAVKCLVADAGTDITLQNLRIVNGNGNNTDGAGIRLYNGTVQDCLISNNVARSGLYISGSGTVERAVFIHNTSHSGGAIQAVNNPFLRIASCRFEANESGNSGGGAVRLAGVSNLMMTNCQLIGNSSSGNGGAITTATEPADGGKNRIVDCLIADNVSSNSGGGIWLYGVGDSYTISDCVISNNTAVNYAGGAEIRCPSVLRNSLIIHNQQTPATDTAARGGGGLGISGGAQVINCRIEGNTTAYQGGGVFNNAGDTLMRNCLILNNSNTGTSYGGGGIRFRWSTGATVENCTIVSNYSVGVGGGIDARDDNIRLINSIIYSNECSHVAHKNYRNYDDLKKVAFTNNCFMPELRAEYTDNSTGNISDDPRFVDADYRLDRSSPCIDQGFNLPWMSASRDLDGYSRIDFVSQIVDIGCYELPHSGTTILIR